VLHGALAAALTPLRDEGRSPDEDAVAPYVDFLAAGGLDGMLVLGTTGEGILLSVDERRRVAERFVEAADGRLHIAVHCGAQTTADTIALAAHAAERADAVAVIGPPYYAFDEDALLAHFLAAAEACAPCPFYVYEFRARAGYSLSPRLLEDLRERAPNLVGLKVSNTPFEAVEPYLDAGLDVFVGSEGLVGRGLDRGAAGAVSGLAAAFPTLVADLVREPSPGKAERAHSLRRALERFPLHAALKIAVARRGVPLQEDVRAPLRGLREDERAELERTLAEWDE
jgi:dihydrodipicolinate synthase/N-acetylneuraminate lyase